MNKIPTKDVARNPAIELYRVVLMFGICLLHSIAQCGHENPRLSALLLPCVNGFVFISGWFGIKFSFKRLWKLIFNSVYAGAMALFLTWLFMPDQLSLTSECFKTVRYVVIGQWFFLAYIVLMLIAPVINFIVDHLNQELAREILLPLAVLMLWNWCAGTPYLERFNYPRGFGSYTPLALSFTYLVGRLVRQYNVFRYINRLYAIIGIIVLACLFVVLSYWNISQYASPLAIVFSGLVFYICSRLCTKNCSLVWIINWVAPSMFTVYLVHSHAFGFFAMTHIENWLLSKGFCIGFCYVITATTIFVIGICSDIPRRLTSAFIRNKRHR